MYRTKSSKLLGTYSWKQPVPYWHGSMYGRNKASNLSQNNEKCYLLDVHCLNLFVWLYRNYDLLFNSVQRKLTSDSTIGQVITFPDPLDPVITWKLFSGPRKQSLGTNDENIPSYIKSDIGKESLLVHLHVAGIICLEFQDLFDCANDRVSSCLDYQRLTSSMTSLISLFTIHIISSVFTRVKIIFSCIP